MECNSSGLPAPRPIDPQEIVKSHWNEIDRLKGVHEISDGQYAAMLELILSECQSRIDDIAEQSESYKAINVMSSFEIVRVDTENSTDGVVRKTIAFAQGEPEHIRIYFDDQRNYQLYLSAVKVHVITPDSIEKKDQLKAEKQRIQNRLKELENLLKL